MQFLMNGGVSGEEEMTQLVEKKANIRFEGEAGERAVQRAVWNKKDFERL